MTSAKCPLEAGLGGCGGAGSGGHGGRWGHLAMPLSLGAADTRPLGSHAEPPKSRRCLNSGTGGAGPTCPRLAEAELTGTGEE